MPQTLKVSICAYGACRSPGITAKSSVKENVSNAIEMIKQASASGADIAILPEAFAVQTLPNWFSAAEPLDGQVVSAISKAAKALSMGVAFGHPTIEDGKLYNSLITLGRDGSIAAVFHKAYPTIHELELGVIPGPGAEVKDTEFGRLGFAVCFDLNFRELRESYAFQRPDLIIFSSAFRGGLQTNWWAYETRCHLASSVIDCQSMIVSPTGKVLAATDAWARQLTTSINLDCEVIHLDYSNKLLQEAILKYGRDFSFEWAEPEGVMLVSALSDMSVKSLMKKMGWEPVEDYFARARKLRTDALAGKAIKKGPLPW